MTKHFLLSALLGLTILFACGTARKAESAQVVPTSDTARLENALLWKVAHPKIKHTSYVFGTIHMIDDDKFFLPAGTERAMEVADKFVFEIDMKEMMNLGAQISLFTKAFMKDGTRLSDLVSEEEYAMVEKHFEGVGLPMMMLDRIKPLFLTVFAGTDIQAGDLQTGELTSYEMEFFDFAEKEEKETGGLETMEFQLSVFDSIPYEDQAEMLMDAIRSEQESAGLFEQMVELYRTQDIEALYTAVGDEETGTGAYGDILLKNRNRRWISGMRTFMEEGPVFFAVGAGHLGGPDGVIRLLRHEGFIVTPVLSDSGGPARKF